MKFIMCLLVLAASCSAATEPPVTVLTGAYAAVSINGNSLPVRVAASGENVVLFSSRSIARVQFSACAAVDVGR